jgi:hypothetical protein
MIWVALSAAGGMALLSARSVAYAFARAVETQPDRPERLQRSRPAAVGVDVDRTWSRGQVALLIVEIAMSLGIALTIVGLTAAAALPGRLLIGALLAQLAVLGALLAPPATLRLGGVRLRPAALALGVAQLAHVAFFLRALSALL